MNNTFLFTSKGDPSVGINGEMVTVIYEGEFADANHKTEFVQAIQEALNNVSDERFSVIEEHKHVCRHCKEEFLHIDDYCDEICTKTECTKAEADAEEAAMAQCEAAYVNCDLSSIDMDADVEYFRSRNERALRSINGAGVRS